MKSATPSSAFGLSGQAQLKLIVALAMTKKIL
jgi:hypothetical protein